MCLRTFLCAGHRSHNYEKTDEVFQNLFNCDSYFTFFTGVCCSSKVSCSLTKRFFVCSIFLFNSCGNPWDIGIYGKSFICEYLSSWFYLCSVFQTFKAVYEFLKWEAFCVAHFLCFACLFFMSGYFSTIPRICTLGAFR